MKKIACILLAGALLVSAAFSEVTFNLGFRAFTSLLDHKTFLEHQESGADRYNTTFIKWNDYGDMELGASVKVSFGEFFASYGIGDTDARKTDNWFSLGVANIGYTFKFQDFGTLLLSCGNDKNPTGLAEGFAGGPVGLVRAAGVGTVNNETYSLNQDLTTQANIKINEDYVGICRFAPFEKDANGNTKQVGYRMFRGLSYNLYGGTPLNLYGVYTLPSFSAVPGTFKLYGTVYTNETDFDNKGTSSANFAESAGWAGIFEYSLPKKFFLDAQYRWYTADSYATGVYTGAYIGSKFRFMTGITFALDGEDKTENTGADSLGITHQVVKQYDNKYAALDLRLRYDFTSKWSAAFSTKITGYQVGLENNYNSNMNDPVTMAEGGIQVNYKYNAIFSNIYAYAGFFTPKATKTAIKMGRGHGQFAIGTNIKPMQYVTVIPEIQFSLSGIGAGTHDDIDYSDYQVFRVNIPITFVISLSHTRK